MSDRTSVKTPATRFVLLLVGACTLSASSLRAAAAYREDFETADPALWTSAGTPTVAIVRADGKAVLRLDGREQQSFKLPIEEHRDFDLRVSIRGPGGIHFRDGYKVFFKPDGEMWIRRPGAMLLDWVRTRRDMDRFNTIRVVCADRIVRVYVNDALEFEGLDHAPLAAPFFFCGSGDVDWLHVAATVPAHEALMVVPQDAGANFVEEQSHARAPGAGTRVPDLALAFASDAALRIPLWVLNASPAEARGVQVHAVFDDFNGARRAEPRESTLSVAANDRTELILDLGVVADGFHRLTLALAHNGRELRTTSYPVFVGVPQAALGFEPPAFPFGVVLQTMIWKPLHTKTYWHGIAALLRACHLNAAAMINTHREFPEILEHYGIATIERTENRLDYPSVIALMGVSRNLARTRALQERTAKPVTFAVSVDDLGTDADDDPLVAWRNARLPVRLLRIHPFRRAAADWLDCREGLRLPEALKQVAAADMTPWWALLQALGHRRDDGELRTPTPAEMRAQTHLALAYGAKGILYASLQDNVDTTALVDYLSLRPRDGNLEAVAELGAFVKRCAESLRVMTPGTHAVGCDSPDVLAVPVRMGERLGVYLVNTNTRATRTSAVSWPGVAADVGVHDLVADKPVPKATNGQWPVFLAAGAGALLVPEP